MFPHRLPIDWFKRIHNHSRPIFHAQRNQPTPTHLSGAFTKEFGTYRNISCSMQINSSLPAIHKEDCWIMLVIDLLIFQICYPRILSVCQISCLSLLYQKLSRVVDPHPPVPWATAKGGQGWGACPPKKIFLLRNVFFLSHMNFASILPQI